VHWVISNVIISFTYIALLHESNLKCSILIGVLN